jgi:hypothetical protein
MHLFSILHSQSASSCNPRHRRPRPTPDLRYLVWIVPLALAPDALADLRLALAQRRRPTPSPDLRCQAPDAVALARRPTCHLPPSRAISAERAPPPLRQRHLLPKTSTTLSPTPPFDGLTSASRTSPRRASPPPSPRHLRSPPDHHPRKWRTPRRPPPPPPHLHSWSHWTRVLIAGG